MSQEQIGTQQSNPLKKYYRQPKQFVRLPSNYKYYQPGTIQIPESGDVAVFPMTAKDELLFKTPDALLNGEATVRVIESCIPAITNAWQMPALDIDACLVAIRMATYGTKMQVKVFVPNTKIEKDMELDLQAALDKLLSNTYVDNFLYENMEITTRPLTYKEFTEAALKTFEEQRLASVVQNQDMDEEEKVKRFQASFNRVDGQTVTDKVQILEFLENTSKEFYQTIIDQGQKQKDNFTIPPVEMIATPEEIKAGAPEKYTVPVLFDQSNFFA